MICGSLIIFDEMPSQLYKRLGYSNYYNFSAVYNGVLSRQLVNAIYDSGNYTDVFERDLIEAEKRVTVAVITTEPKNIRYGSPDFYQQMTCEMQKNGIHIILREKVAEHFAILDDELVWHGGMNLLGEEDVWDNLIRIKSAEEKGCEQDTGGNRRSSY